MAFQIHHYMLFLLCIPFLVTHRTYSIPSQFDSPPNSIYDAFKSHGLPIGLLPKGVRNFTFDSESGRFEVFLDQSCNAKFESELHYDRDVSGTLRYGQIANMTGISAKELFLWFQVKAIHVDIPSSGLIYFDVGVAFKELSLSLFETPPDCTAVTLMSSPDVEDERSIVQAVYKSQYDKLFDERYEQEPLRDTL